MKQILLTTAIFLCLPCAARADSKIFGVWWPSHWHDQNFTPYYDDDATLPHNAQWMGKDWTPTSWVQTDPQQGYNLVNTWHKAGILGNINLANNAKKPFVSVVNIGPNFYHLSGFDKRRVMETFNAVYQVTATRSPAMFYVRDPSTGKIIGTFTKEGLTLE